MRALSLSYDICSTTGVGDGVGGARVVGAGVGAAGFTGSTSFFGAGFGMIFV